MIYLDNGTLMRTLAANSQVWSLAVLPNGHLSSGHDNGDIKIWDTDDSTSNDPIKTINAHNASVNALAVLQNGYLASGSDDKTIKI
jgi:WD40 repeat protein